MPKQSKTKLQNDGERMVPALHKGELMYAEHLIRYEAAQDLVAGKVVLDIASGSGYGTHILAAKAKKVYGVDVSEEAVRYADENYGAKNIEYKQGSGTQIPLPDDSVDVFITFETIEHIEEYEEFISEMDRVLRPDGVAIVSTPNDLEFAEGNHFHVHEFTYPELTGLLKKTFKHIKPYFQATWKYVALGPDGFMEQAGVLDMPTENLAPLTQDQCLYFYLICSRRPITENIKPLAALGGHYSDRSLTEFVTNSNTTINRLTGEKVELTARLQAAETELTNIKSSRMYNVARKLSKAKNIVKPKK